jgi:hypothetical protein
VIWGKYLLLDAFEIWLHLHQMSEQRIFYGLPYLDFIFPNIFLLQKCNFCLILVYNSGALFRQRTIPTERPPLVSEVSANFSG